MKPVPFRLVHSCWHSFSSQLRSWPKSGVRQHRAHSLTHLKQILSLMTFDEINGFVSMGRTMQLLITIQVFDHPAPLWLNLHVSINISSNRIFLSTCGVMAIDRAVLCIIIRVLLCPEWCWYDKKARANRLEERDRSHNYGIYSNLLSLWENKSKWNLFFFFTQRTFSYKITKLVSHNSKIHTL